MNTATPEKKPSRASAIALFATCLLLPSMFVWWFFAGRAPGQDTITFKEPPRSTPERGQRGGGGRDRGGRFQDFARRFSENMPPGIHTVRDNEWRVRAGELMLRVRKENNGGLDLDFNYMNNEIPREQMALLFARGAVLRDDQAAKRAGVTPEQIQKLREIEGGMDAPVPEADRKQIQELFTGYLAAADAAAKKEVEKHLQSELERIAKGNKEAAKQALVQRAEKIKSVLTEKQLEMLRQRMRDR